MKCDVCKERIWLGGDVMAAGDYWTHENSEKDEDHQIVVNGKPVDTGIFNGWVGAQ